MEIVLLKFSAGLLILLFSTQKLVVLAEKISRKFRISPLIVGITIVAIGTSLPELTVSIISILKNDSGLAMGNIIGSNIANILMVFPTGILLGNLRIGTTKTQRSALILLVVTALFFLSRYVGEFRKIFGISLIGLSVLVSFIEYQFGVSGRLHEDLKRFKMVYDEKLNSFLYLLALFLILGIIVGGILVVNSIEGISLLTGIPTTVLGLTLSAVATSLPELLTTVFSQKNHQEKITIGNVIGSNIYNLLLIGGIISLFPLTRVVSIGEWLWLVITTISFVFILRYYKGKRPPKYIGLILLLFFFVYIFTQ
ncbi:sodium:calcium antiporter [Candidatus Parcubacteria bacterium]|nr:sodium:calcium antiporter [Candidatus Parcubacteria bacterium]